MENKKFKEAFSAVKASDDMVNAVLELPAQARPGAGRSGWSVLARVAATAAVVALLIGAMVLPAPPASVTDPSGSTQVVPNSLFGIYVYADGNLVNLNNQAGDPFFAGEEDKSVDNDYGYFDDREVKVYNTETGEWEVLQKNKDEGAPIFDLVIWVGNLDKIYSPDILIYMDGELMPDMNFYRDINYFGTGWTWIGKEKRAGWRITCRLDHEADVEIVIRDKHTETLLVKHKLHVIPAINKIAVESTKPNSSNATEVWLQTNEGYLLEVIESYRIDTDLLTSRE